MRLLGGDPEAAGEEMSLEEVRRIIEDNRDKIEAMTAALLEWETIDAEQIDDIMHGRPPRAPQPPSTSNDTSDNTPPTGLTSAGGSAAATPV